MIEVNNSDSNVFIHYRGVRKGGVRVEELIFVSLPALTMFLLFIFLWSCLADVHIC